MSVAETTLLEVLWIMLVMLNGGNTTLANQLINGVEIHSEHDITPIIIIAFLTFVVNHECSQEGVGLVQHCKLACASW